MRVLTVVLASALGAATAAPALAAYVDIEDVRRMAFDRRRGLCLMNPSVSPLTS